MIGGVSSTPAAKPVVSSELKAVAKQFEAVFARQMIGSMRTAKLGEDILGSDAGDQFRDMADARLAESMADKGTFGIAEMLIKQFGGTVRATAK